MLHLALGVAVGGALGALARTLLSMAGGGSPWVTLAENVAGAFLLALLLGWSGRTRLPAWLLTGLGTGLLGSFTSMSALAADAVSLSTRAWLSASTYLVLSLSLSLAAAAFGLRLGARVPERRATESP